MNVLSVAKDDPWLWKSFIILLVFWRRDREEWMLCPPRHPFLANHVLEFVPHRFRSDLADVHCVTKGCTFYLQKKKVHNKSFVLSGFSECERPRKMRFPRGASRFALSKFKRHRCRNAPVQKTRLDTRSTGEKAKS